MGHPAAYPNARQRKSEGDRMQRMPAADADGWIDADAFLKAYANYEEPELDRLEPIRALMEQPGTVRGETTDDFN